MLLSPWGKRPTDPNQLGKLIMDIATGQVVDEEEVEPTKERAPELRERGRKKRRGQSKK